MQVAVHPGVRAGVAVVGAGLIAASTIAAVPDVHLPSVPIEFGLTAAVNPLDVYPELIRDALDNAGTLADSARPFQLLRQIAQNQFASASALVDALAATGDDVGAALGTQVPALLRTAVDEFAAGNVAGATDALVQIPLVLGLPLIDLVPALQEVVSRPLENLVRVINAFDPSSLETQLLVGGLVAPLISTPAAAGAAIQNIVDAVGSGDLVQVVQAVLAAPGVVVDGLLNGGYGPDLGPLVGAAGIPVKAGGLLSSAGLVFTPDGQFFVNTGGPIAAVQQILNTITAAITPQAPTVKKAVPAETAHVASVPSAQAPAVTVTVPEKAVPDTEAPDKVVQDKGARDHMAPESEAAAGDTGTAEVDEPAKSEKPAESPREEAHESTGATATDEATDVKDAPRAADDAAHESPATGAKPSESAPKRSDDAKADRPAARASADGDA